MIDFHTLESVQAIKTAKLRGIHALNRRDPVGEVPAVVDAQVLEKRKKPGESPFQ